MSKVNTQRLEELKKFAQNYAVLHGLIFRVEQNFNTPPMTLCPTIVPKSAFVKVKNLMKPMNHLRDLVSRDYQFLKTHLSEYVNFVLTF